MVPCKNIYIKLQYLKYLMEMYLMCQLYIVEAVVAFFSSGPKHEYLIPLDTVTRTVTKSDDSMTVLQNLSRTSIADVVGVTT